MQAGYKEILSRYFPPETVGQVAGAIEKHQIRLKFTARRNTKLGDFRPPGNTVNAPRITLNGNLNPWFLYLVFIHELAHLLIWKKYARGVAPHGKQWKQEFSALLHQAVYLNLIPCQLKEPVLDFAANIKATFGSHPGLYKALKNLDPDGDQEITIEEIPSDSYFVAANGRLFKKEERVRTRYRCYCLDNNKRYLFHPLAAITPVHNNDKL